MQVANLLFNSQLAKGTSKAYGRVIARFREHCDSSDQYSYENFGEREVGSFVIEMTQRNLSKTFMACIKPAIERIERIKGVRDTAFSLVVCSWLEGARRLACEVGPPLKKWRLFP